jgi:hypothetical protein
VYCCGLSAQNAGPGTGVGSGAVASGFAVEVEEEGAIVVGGVVTAGFAVVVVEEGAVVVGFGVVASGFVAPKEGAGVGGPIIVGAAVALLGAAVIL